MSDLPVFFQGEVQFRRYSDTSTQGQQVVFALADREALAAFIGKEGKRFACVLVEVGDDEQPVPQQPKAEPRPEAPKGGPLARLAGMWCQDAAFQRWLMTEYPDVWGSWLGEAGDDPARTARFVVLDLCEISSRAQLDHDATTAEHFQRAIRRPYMAHCGLPA